MFIKAYKTISDESPHPETSTSSASTVNCLDISTFLRLDINYTNTNSKNLTFWFRLV